EVIHNAIDTTRFAPGPGDPGLLDALARLPRPRAGVLRVGLVATFGIWKGHEVFLRAAARLAAREMRFYVVGGPIYATGAQVREADLRRLAAELDIEQRVGFVGFQEDTAAIYRALDIVVHASDRPEPFGRT